MRTDILENLKRDLEAARGLKNEQDDCIAKWKKEHNGEPYGNEVTGKSAIVSRDIKRQSEWQHSSIIDPFVSSPDIIKCSPITWEDKELSEQTELVLNTQFTRKFNRYSFMTKAIKVLDSEGTVVIQTGWDYEDYTRKVEREVVLHDEHGQYIDVEEVDEVVIVKNQPTAIVRRNIDVYLDPTCQDDIDNAQFVITRYESDLSNLRQDPNMSNLGRVAKEMCVDGEYTAEDDTGFEFTDDPRKKLVVYEYWGNYDLDGDGNAEPMVCCWVGDNIIRLEPNPYPDQKIPFVVVPFNSVPFKMHGEANAELIGDNQKVKTAIVRGIVDNLAKSNNGQIGFRKGALDPLNKKRYEQDKNFEFNTNPNDIWQGSYNQIPSTAFDVLGLMNNEIESLTGTKNFSGGINSGSLGQHATGARGALDAASVRRMNIVRNIAENMIKPIMRKWMAYNSKYLSEEEVTRITNTEFVPIREDDLAGLVDINISVSTAEDNDAKVQKLSFLLQTNAAIMDPNLQKLAHVNIAKLMGMPEYAKEIEEFEATPDPVQERLDKMAIEKAELENELIRAKIEDTKANMNEDRQDIRLKDAKTREIEAKIRTTNANTDIKNLDFVIKDKNINHLNAMERDMLKVEANERAMAYQSIAGSEDEQIGVSL